MTATAVRQGDVMLYPSPLPSTAKKVTLRPLALGEKTGHHHSLMTADEVILDDIAEMYEDGDGNVFVRILDEGALLGHQEHKTHAINPGSYQVVIQRENTDFGDRAVLD